MRIVLHHFGERSSPSTARRDEPFPIISILSFSSRFCLLSNPFRFALFSLVGVETNDDWATNMLSFFLGNELPYVLAPETRFLSICRVRGERYPDEVAIVFIQSLKGGAGLHSPHELHQAPY